MGARGLRFAMWSPVVFVLVVGALTALNWEFLADLGVRFRGESEAPWPSSTALGRLGWLQALNFLQIGAAVAVLGAAARRQVMGRASTVGAGALWIAALATVALAFPTDPTWEVVTLSGAVHTAGFFVFLLALLTALVALARSAHHRVRRVSGIALIVVMVFLIVSFAVPDLGAVAAGLAFLTLCGWVTVTSSLLLGPAPADA